MESFRNVVYTLRDRYLPYHEGRLIWHEETSGLIILLSNKYNHLIIYCISYIIHILDYNLKLPPWLCQPYVRHLPEEKIQKLEIEKIEKVSLI